MQVKKHIIYIMLVIVMIGAYSCSVSKHATSRFQTMSQRAQLTLNWDQQQYGMNSTIRVWYDELTIISVQPMLGIEMVRMEAKQDSIWIFDKMNRRYTAISYKDLGQIINTKMTYKTLQEFVTAPIVENKKEYVAMELNTDRHQMKISCHFSNREYNTLQYPTQTNTNKYKRVSLREIIPL